MNLEIKHLLPYLPYGLKVKHASRLGNTKKEATLTLSDYNWLKNQTYFKPILEPLSSFQEEHIEEIKEFLDQNWCEVYDDFFDALFEHDWLMHTRILMCPYEILQWFFKNHYDVYGLIEDDLAININTL